jgi:hypothetical protein
MGVVDKIPMAPDEQKIDTWTVFYYPPKGGKYNGKLLVTNRRLCYDAKFDVSASGMLSEALFMKSGSEGYLEIPKQRISNVGVQKSFFAKKVLVTLDDGSVHTFSYGIASVDKIAAAIQQR